MWTVAFGPTEDPGLAATSGRVDDLDSAMVRTLEAVRAHLGVAVDPEISRTMLARWLREE